MDRLVQGALQSGVLQCCDAAERSPAAGLEDGIPPACRSGQLASVHRNALAAVWSLPPGPNVGADLPSRHPEGSQLGAGKDSVLGVGEAGEDGCLHPQRPYG